MPLKGRGRWGPVGKHTGWRYERLFLPAKNQKRRLCRRQKNRYRLRRNHSHNSSTRSSDSSCLSGKNSVIGDLLKRQNGNGHLGPVIQLANLCESSPTTVMNELHRRQFELIRSKVFYTHRYSPCDRRKGDEQDINDCAKRKATRHVAAFGQQNNRHLRRRRAPQVPRCACADCGLPGSARFHRGSPRRRPSTRARVSKAMQR